jgi:hypothetical protein
MTKATTSPQQILLGIGLGILLLPVPLILEGMYLKGEMGRIGRSLPCRAVFRRDPSLHDFARGSVLLSGG